MATITPYIPQRITVHLGSPGSDAANVTVSFADYVKNVASSEIYPTWDESALRANILAIVAAAITLVAVSQHSLPLCIVGLCLTGMSYGTVPTNTSAFASAFYGTEHFGTNLSVLNFNLMLASFMATACSAIRTATGGYVVPFAILLGMASLALVLNISVKKP